MHCCCASALKAKLAVDETAQNEAVKASAKLTLRTVLANSVGSFSAPVGSAKRAPLLMDGTCADPRSADCD